MKIAASGKRRARRPARVREARPSRQEAVPGTRYVESSAVVRARSAGGISPSQERDALLSIDAFARRCAVVGVADVILERAGQPFPIEPIRTLDAVHLATLELLDSPRESTTIVSRDTRMCDNARALGFEVE